jgi:hypothetical protein
MTTRIRRIVLVAVLAVSFGVVLPCTAGAQDSNPGESKLTIHGYLTQAYAKSDGIQLTGIPDDGTFDYRRAALLFNYAPTGHDKVVLQLAQRRLGESPIQVLEPDVKLDWAYYSHAFDTGTTVRAGRLPLPRGFLNEVRYVGTVLPFYRVPFTFYQEGAFTSESIDGVSVRQAVGKGPWSLELNGFVGQYSLVELWSTGVDRALAKNVVGGQALLQTPLDGLHLVAGGHRYDLRQSALTESGRDRETTWNVGGEFVRERYVVRSEYSPLFFKEAGFSHKAYYVYGGVGLTSKLWAHGELDQANVYVSVPGQTFKVSDWHHDLAAGLSYAFRPDLVVKAEYHWAKTLRPENDKAITRDFNPKTMFLPPDKVNFFILSVSASF